MIEYVWCRLYSHVFRASSKFPSRARMASALKAAETWQQTLSRLHYLCQRRNTANIIYIYMYVSTYIYTHIYIYIYRHIQVSNGSNISVHVHNDEERERSSSGQTQKLLGCTRHVGSRPCVSANLSLIVSTLEADGSCLRFSRWPEQP